eukprot:Lankesteria_metandrocarpae@DN7672_c0_g1_i1.p1
MVKSRLMIAVGITATVLINRCHPAAGCGNISDNHEAHSELWCYQNDMIKDIKPATISPSKSKTGSADPVPAARSWTELFSHSLAEVYLFSCLSKKWPPSLFLMPRSHVNASLRLSIRHIQTTQRGLFLYQEGQTPVPVEYRSTFVTGPSDDPLVRCVVYKTSLSTVGDMARGYKALVYYPGRSPTLDGLRRSPTLDALRKVRQRLQQSESM